MVDSAALLAAHHDAPRNMGRMNDAAATGTVGSILVGRALRIFVAVADGRISGCRFQVFSCADEIAATSLMTETVIGLELDEARALDAAALAERNGIDRFALPALPWGLEGLRQALAKLDDPESAPGVDDELPALVCRCFAVSEASVRDDLRAGRHADVAAITAATRAGSGCGSCTRDLERIVAEELERSAEPAPPAPASQTRPAAAGRITLLKRIAQALEQPLRELGDRGIAAELRDLRGSSVLVRFGAGVDPGARGETIALLRERLRAEVDEALEVESEV